MKHFLVLILFFSLTHCSSKKHDTLLDVLPKGMKTKPCDIQQANLFNYVYVYNNEKVLLLNQENQRLMYFTEVLAPGQTPESWYEAFYQVKAEEAGTAGSSGHSYYYAQGEQKVTTQEGVTFYTKIQDVNGQKIELASLLCAVSEDETQLVFAAVNTMIPKSELIKNFKIYQRTFGGEARKRLEEKIIQAATDKLRKTKQGSRIERAKPDSL